MPPLPLAGANEAHLTFFSQDQRQAKPGIFRTQLPGNAAERAFGAGDERGDFVCFARVMSVRFHTSINCCTEFHFRRQEFSGEGGFSRAVATGNQINRWLGRGHLTFLRFLRPCVFQRDRPVENQFAAAVFIGRERGAPGLFLPRSAAGQAGRFPRAVAAPRGGTHAAPER